MEETTHIIMLGAGTIGLLFAALYQSQPSLSLRSMHDAAECLRRLPVTRNRHAAVELDYKSLRTYSTGPSYCLLPRKKNQTMANMRVKP